MDYGNRMPSAGRKRTRPDSVRSFRDRAATAVAPSRSRDTGTMHRMARERSRPESHVLRPLPSSQTNAKARRRITLVAACVALLSTIFVIWPWTPLARLVDFTAIYTAVAGAEQTLLAIGGLLALFAVSALLFLPVTPLIVLAMLAFGPVAGALWSLAGIVFAAQIGFSCGRILGHRDIARLRDGSIYRASRFMAERGILKTAILRVIPMAHFTAISFALGASHVRWRHYALGTLLGSLLTLAVMAIMFERTAAVMSSPSPERIVVLAVITLILVAVLIWLQRRSRAVMRNDSGQAQPGSEERNSC